MDEREELEEELCRCLKAGDTETLSFLLEEGLNEDYLFRCCKEKEFHGKTLLQVAASRTDLGEKRIALVKLLLEYDCDVNLCARIFGYEGSEATLKVRKFKDRLPNTCIYYAVKEQDVELAQLLVDGGADVNYFDNGCSSALWHAVDTDNKSLVKVLLSAKGCNVNLQDMWKVSPLYVAATNESPNVVELLLENNAKVDIQEWEGSTSLGVACLNGCENVARVLLQHGSDPNVQKRTGVSPLYAAFYRSEDRNIVRMLIDAGSKVSTRDFKSRLPKPLKGDEDFKDFVLNCNTRPRSLKILSAMAIKCKLFEQNQGTSIKRDMLSLPLPKVLKSYLLLEHI